MLPRAEWGELHALTALATSEIPVLAIAGEHDRGTPPAAARRIAATAPRGGLVVLDGVGHFRVRRGARRLLGRRARLARPHPVSGQRRRVAGRLSVDPKAGVASAAAIAGRQQRGEDGRLVDHGQTLPRRPARGNAPIG